MKPDILPNVKEPIALTAYDTALQSDIARAINRILRASAPETVYLDVSSKQLPPTYQLVQEQQREANPKAAINSHAYQELLPHIERMSKQGMSLKFIAARLGVAQFALEEAITLFPDVRAAITGGLARGVDEQSEAMYRRGLGEDTSAGKFFLQTRGEFNPPQAAGTSVTVNVGQQPAAVTTIDVDSMAERQRLLLEGEAEEEG